MLLSLLSSSSNCSREEEPIEELTKDILENTLARKVPKNISW